MIKILPYILTAATLIGLDANLYAQINDTLKVLCADIKVLDDDSDPNYSGRYRSGDYSLIIQNDSLLVSIETLMRSKNRDSTKVEKTHRSLFKYKASLKEIGAISFEHRFIKYKYGNGFDDSTMKIESIRNDELFDRIYEDGQMNKTDYISFNVINHSDTSKFKKIVAVLNEYIKPENNFLPANCQTDITHAWSGRSINAIDNKNLQNPIYLDGTECTENLIKAILKDFLKEQNIKSLLGYVLVNKDNTIKDLWTEQYRLFEIINTNDTLPVGYKTIIENVGTIDNNQMEEIRQLLKQHEWYVGSCDNIFVDSYFDFIIKNDFFKDPKIKKP